MISVIPNLQQYVAGFKATGRVTAEDYKKVVLPEIDRVAENSKEINFLLLLDTDIKNYDLAAWAKDMGAGFKYFSRWKKIAVVSDQDWVGKIYETVGYLVPGNVKSFRKSELNDAENWVKS